LPVFEPLFLESLGHSMSMIGRVMMIFGIFMFCVAPISHKISKWFKKPATSTVICGLFVSLSMIIQYAAPTPLGASLSMMVFSFGIMAHVSSMMATLELVAQNSKEEDARGKVINMYFLYERIAMACGPLIASSLINYTGYQNTLLIFSCVLIFSNILYYLIHIKTFSDPLEEA
jgi:predicted MFS family arabinose efflux permease